MIIKPGVKLLGVQPQVLWAAAMIHHDFFPVVITTGTEGKHRERSDHYKGLALDLRSKHLDMSVVEKRVLALDAQESLGGEFICLFEGEGTPNEHFHLAWRPA